MNNIKPRNWLALGLFIAALALAIFWPWGQLPLPTIDQSQTAARIANRTESSDRVQPAADSGGQRVESLQIMVRVRTQQGAAIPGAAVKRNGLSVITGADGSCALGLKEFSPGQFIEVSGTGYQTTIAELTSEDTANGRKDVMLATRSSLRGNCIDHRGLPIAGVGIRVFDGRFPDLRIEAEVGKTNTDQKGRFSVELVAGGLVYVRPDKFGYVAAYESQLDDGAQSHTIRIAVIGETDVIIQMFPIVVSAIGIVNSSDLPGHEVANYCAFARDILGGVSELLPSMHDTEALARKRVKDIGAAFSHLSLWVGRVSSREYQQIMPVRVETIDGVSTIVETKLTPITEFDIGDITTYDTSIATKTGDIDLVVRYPTTVALIRDGRATIWQRTLLAGEGRTRVTLPVGKHIITPSSSTLLDRTKRQREVDVVHGQVAVVSETTEDAPAVVKVVVVDSAGPVSLEALHIQVLTSQGRVSLRGIRGEELLLYVEPGECSVLVRDVGSRLRGRLSFVAEVGSNEPVIVAMNQ